MDTPTKPRLQEHFSTNKVMSVYQKRHTKTSRFEGRIQGLYQLCIVMCILSLEVPPRISNRGGSTRAYEPSPTAPSPAVDPPVPGRGTVAHTHRLDGAVRGSRAVRARSARLRKTGRMKMGGSFSLKCSPKGSKRFHLGSLNDGRMELGWGGWKVDGFCIE